MPDRLVRVIPIVALLACAGSLNAQIAAKELFSKAPPEVDQALRERVGKFYQAHIDGKFRVADQYVAEDSKDAFFEADKVRYRSYEIMRIDYTDDFTKAKVLAACGGVFRRAGNEFKVNIPVTSTWKLENGEWFWYFIPSKVTETPFGKMTPGTAPGSDPAQPKPAVPNIQQAAQQILQSVKIDKSEVMLSSYKPAKDSVTIANGMPGPITVKVEYQGFQGFSARMDNAQIEGGKMGKLLLEVDPKDKTAKPTVIVNVRVEPTGQVMPVKVTFDVPEDMKKLLNNKK